ncbi:hypothetical protein PanWU01x14_175740 [Parasponia andersonii]|uniref:Uncharacterized protein n=1 Tax=Parasponia andersonii TaxID=3476 RepID=A0A2P5C7V9_PARAD|nr:hypothetical protein PanWU01x14_175740 [Parasponia andersonii]
MLGFNSPTVTTPISLLKTRPANVSDFSLMKLPFSTLKPLCSLKVSNFQ